MARRLHPETFAVENDHSKGNSLKGMSNEALAETFPRVQGGEGGSGKRQNWRVTTPDHSRTNWVCFGRCRRQRKFATETARQPHQSGAICRHRARRVAPIIIQRLAAVATIGPRARTHPFCHQHRRARGSNGNGVAAALDEQKSVALSLV